MEIFFNLLEAGDTESCRYVPQSCTNQSTHPHIIQRTFIYFRYHTNRLVSPRHLPLSPPSLNKDPAIGANPRLDSNPLTDDGTLSRPSGMGPRKRCEENCLADPAAESPCSPRPMLADLGLVSHLGSGARIDEGALSRPSCTGPRADRKGSCLVFPAAGFPYPCRAILADLLGGCSMGACGCLARCCDL